MKKIVTLFSVMGLLSFVGCGGGDGGSDADAAATTTTLAATTTGETSTTTTGVAQDAHGQPLAIDLGNGVSMEFVWVGSGEFNMGSEDSDAETTERPVHRVRISKGFWLGKFEVTQAQWQQVMGSNPSYVTGVANPVELMNWNELQAFITSVSQRPEVRDQGLQVRLPTEAEWEYAAKGGSLSRNYKYSGSDNMDEVGWCDDNSGGKSQPVGGKRPNELGLYDMSGNVWEWCSDWYSSAYSSGNATDPTGPSSGVSHVVRGGSWFHTPRDGRPARRTYFVDPARGFYLCGVRIVVVAP